MRGSDVARGLRGRRVARHRALQFAAVMTMVGGTLSSCRESIVPRFGVVLRVTQQMQTVGTDGRGLPTLTCGVGLEAITSGSGQAEWGDAVVYFFAINDATTVLDSLAVPAAAVQGSWGATVIGANEPQESGWTLTSGIPITATFKYRYQIVGGAADSTQVSAACAPAAPKGPPPTFAALSTGPSSLLQPGGKLVVDYTVTSSVGLWVTLLSVTGPCDTVVEVGEPLLATDTRTLTIPIPSSCALGVPLNVQIVTYDALLQSTSMISRLPALVDTVPPTVGAMIGPRWGGSYTTDLSGDWFVGDSIAVILYAQDNGVIHSLHWDVQPDGFADSMVVDTPGGIIEYLSIPLQASMAGPIQLRFFSRDLARNTSDTITSAAGAIDVIPTVNLLATRATINPPGGIGAWDARRNQLYFNREYGNQIGIFSRSAGAIIGTIQLSAYPLVFDLTPGGDSLVVAEYGNRLAFVDLRTGPPVVTEMPLSGVDSTMSLVGLVAAGNGKVLVTSANYAAGTGHLYTYDLASGALQLRTDAGVAGQTGAGSIVGSYDRSVVVLNGGPGVFQRYEAATDAFGPPKTAQSTGVLAVDGTGAHVTVGGAIYDSTLQYVVTPSVFHYSSQPMVLSPDGSTIYFSYGNAGNVRCRTSDGTTIDHLQYPVVVNQLVMSPDGSTLAAIEEDLNANTLGFVTVPPPSSGSVARAAHPLPSGSSLAAHRATSPGGAVAAASSPGVAAWTSLGVPSNGMSGGRAVARLRLLARPVLREARRAR